MKRIIKLIFGVFCLSGYGQDLPESEQYYIDYNNIELPQTPNAFGFTVYGDIPVNTSTGIPDIKIPIYSLVEDNIEVPISLSYHASGVQVDELATAVGLKWTLNVGGGIFRTIKNKADEEQGWLDPNYTSISNSWYANDLYQVSWQNQTRDKAENNDHNPDDFSYGFLGYSGDFIFKKDSTLLKSREDQLELIPHVESQGLSFTAKDLHGNIFSFGADKEFGSNSISYSSIIQGGNYDYDGYEYEDHPTGWMLSQITTKNGNAIHFEYEPYNLNYELLQTSHHLTKVKSCSPDNNPKGKKSATSNHYDYTMQLIKRIYTDHVEIIFDYTTDNNLSHWKRKLTRITVNDLLKGNKRTFNFIYDKFNGDPRLKLKGVYETGSNNIPKPGYTFYYDARPLPQKASFSKDFFGYYNGVTTNPTLVHRSPALESLFSNDPQYLDNNAGNRSLGEGYIQAGILKKIEYPTGGSTEFTYEPNKEGNKYSGGLRIKTIEDKDTDGKSYNRKQYTYSGLVGNDMESMIHFTRKEVGESVSYYSSFVAESNLVPTGHYYEKVVVRHTDGQIWFDKEYNYISEPYYGRRHAVPKTVKAYKGTNTLLKITEYEYASIGTQETINWNVLADKICMQISGDNSGMRLGYTTGWNQTRFGNTANLPVQIATTEFLDHESASLHPVTIMKNYQYNDKLLPETEIINSRLTRSVSGSTTSYITNDTNADKITINYTYPLDYSNEYGLQHLPGALPISKQVFSDNQGSLIYGQYFAYDANGNIKTSYHYNKGQGNNSNAPDYVPDNYEEKASFVYMDGKPVQVSKPGNTGAPASSISYIYGYGNQHLIAEIKNKSYADIPSTLIAAARDASNNGTESQLATALDNIHNSLPDARVTTYIHKPLIGTSTIVDPRGGKTTYTYDPFSRLEFVKDEDDKLLEEYKYHYKN
ncbi:hypothetical protein LS482_09585 [Sinomicrobium kalidii]|uniref:hypothetical protein n=1 Tax=Sinomicrobium kalidii TaxID=2900738 RepID=UPI001E5D4EBB|nr:hypothetical protein [Sinomicrobium kalidii]UGU18118.1 hypothetical protein LS482_09585 [Sinomicrobium kalidii]